ncbi:MAG: LCP family protein [Armatimonadota bacterium]|nr:LCP family protein [Armatimonadota bacterium]MDR5696933.1 LCP family protein [Armatimonadota bacterium]
MTVPPEDAPRPTPPPTPRWTRAASWAVRAAFAVFAGFLVGALGAALVGMAHNPEDAVLGRQAAGRIAFPLRLADRVNVLIMGVDVTLDNRRQPTGLARADTLILATFDPHTQRVAFLSIPRDTRAHIPGRGGWWKINAAYAFGGPALTIRTVENLLDVPIHYYVKLGPQSFAKLIDAVGGVWVDVEQDMKYQDWWGDLYIDLKRGRQLLAGQQAMGYVRFRHDALGDIGRTERQQKVIQALFARLKEPEVLLRAPQILRAAAENTETNLRPHDMATLGWFLKRLGGDRIAMATLPGRFAPLFWEPDWARARPLVLDMFYGLDAETVGGATVEVLNGSGVPGLAREVAARLSEVGFRVVRVDTAPELQDQTAVIANDGRAQLARAVREMIGVGAIATRPRPHAQASLTVVVARDYANRRTARLGGP